MIRVRREPTPEVLDRNAAVWQTALRLAPTARVRQRLVRKYQHKQIKQALVRSFHGKCVYCESKIVHVDYAHIEHFRPKGKHPDLTFEWTNLLLACGIFNGTSYKGERFPDAADGGPLVNPCDEEPELHLVFSFDPIAKLASVYGRTRRGETTVNVLGLNRHELREYRSRQIQRLVALSHFASIYQQAADLLEEARLSSSEYAAFARALTRTDAVGVGDRRVGPG